MTTPDLKPCPFCGSLDIDIRYGLDGWISNVFRPYRVAFVQCNYCLSRTKRCMTAEWAVKMWNRRVSDD